MQVIFKRYELSKLKLEIIARKFIPILIKFYEIEENNILFKKWLKNKKMEGK